MSLHPPPLLEMKRISKRFSGVQALSQVSLTLRAGEVLALMGENGAGKSTLMKVLAGAYKADEGEIVLEGHPVQIHSPLRARALGIHLIYQELNLAPNLTVMENIFMGAERSSWGLLDTRAMRLEAQRALDRLGASFGPDTLVSRLSVAEGQLVEIARALTFQLRILVMDEPTAALSERESERLFEVIGNLKARGIGIIYISHRMAEVYALADRVSVLRDGQAVGTLERAAERPRVEGLRAGGTRAGAARADPDPRREGINAERVVRLMVGQAPQEFYPHPRPLSQGPALLELRELSGGNKLERVSLSLRPGEIVGLAGLVGSGRTELLRLIFGADLKTGGEVWLDGHRLELRSPRQAIKAGIGFVPEDRKQQGLFLEMTGMENLCFNVLGKHTRLGLLDFAGLRREARAALERLNMRVSSPLERAVHLSGGNQQKLLLARWLALKPRVLLLDEPTRGVDITTKTEIYRLVSELAAQGVATLCVSSEWSELAGLCDRVLILREGRLAGELDPTRGEKITPENILEFATGLKVWTAEDWQARAEFAELERMLV